MSNVPKGPGQVEMPHARRPVPRTMPPGPPPKGPGAATPARMSVKDDSPTTIAIRAIQREAQVKLLDELIRECDPYNWSSPDEADAIANFREVLRDKRVELTT